MARVLFTRSRVEPFRAPFYAGLQARLAGLGIAMQVAVPRPNCGDRPPDWLLPVSGGEIGLAGKTLAWQSITPHLRGLDLIVMQQNASQLTNYWLLACRQHFGYRVAAWGHGVAFQTDWATPLSRWLKRTLLSQVDFWFAYTPKVASIVEGSGFPRNRICTVFNAIDMENEQRFRHLITEEQKQALRRELGMQSSAHLISFCGSLYKAKRLEFLLEACRRVRNGGLELHLAIIGDGGEERWLRARSQEEPWVHLVGPAQGERKALLLGVSTCMAVSGVVGLAVVDAFAHECPLVTTDIPGHGPEIEYLLPKENGLKTADNVQKFADGITAVLCDPELRGRLQQGCREAASRLTLRNMVECFAAGIVRALQFPPGFVPGQEN